MATYDSPSYVDSDTFTVSGDHTSGEGGFDEGRRVRCDCDTDGIKYGTVESASYSDPNTTVNLDAASDAITSNLKEVVTSPVRPGDSGNVPHKLQQFTVLQKTDDYSVTTDDLGKSLRMNAATSKTFTLPSVGAGDDGKRITFIKEGAGDLVISASDSDIIVLEDSESGAGGSITCSQTAPEQASLTLEYDHSETAWIAVEGMIANWFPSDVLGVKWDQSADTWTRININGDEYSWAQSDFDNHPVWGGMTRVNLAVDGTENYEYGDASYAEDGTEGRVMVKIPQFYCRATVSGDDHSFWIADYKFHADAEVFPLFYHRNNVGSPVDHWYVGAYEADGYDDSGTFKLHSRAGYTPVTGGVSYTDLPNSGRFTIDDAEDYANNIGTGWGNVNIWAVAAWKLLMMIEWGNLDSQSELGRGIVDKASGTGFAGENTGADSINSQLDSQLTGTGTGTDGLTPVTYRGIENPWGNAWSFVIGFNAVDAEYRVIDRDGVASATMDGTLGAGDYESSSATPLTDDEGYIDDIETEALLLPLLVPSSSAGGDSSHIPDYVWSHDGGTTNILLGGGNWTNGSRAGAGAWGGSFVASKSTRSSGGRLEYAS